MSQNKTANWITMHPNGTMEVDIPILLRETGLPVTDEYKEIALAVVADYMKKMHPDVAAVYSTTKLTPKNILALL